MTFLSVAIFKNHKSVVAKDMPAVKDLLPSIAMVFGLALDNYHLNHNELYLSAWKYRSKYRWSCDIVALALPSLRSGVLIPDTIHLLTTNVTIALSQSIAIHCRLHNGLALRQSALCPTSCGLQYSDRGFIQEKGIVLSKGILIIRQSDEHCTLVKDLSENVGIIDG